MQLLANENFPLVSVQLLRQAGYEIASITEDSPGIEDPEVLARAVDEQRIILTFDRDYGELIYRFRLPPPKGVIYLRFRPHKLPLHLHHILDFLKARKGERGAGKR